MRRRRGWLLIAASCIFSLTAWSEARCAQQNQAAMRTYQRERAATYGYYGAYGANQALKFGAGRVVPQIGGSVYGGGNSVGNQLYNGYTGQPPRVLQPGYQPSYPYPFGPPRTFNYQRPPPPSYQPYGTTTRRVW